MPVGLILVHRTPRLRQANPAAGGEDSPLIGAQGTCFRQSRPDPAAWKGLEASATADSPVRPDRSTGEASGTRTAIDDSADARPGCPRRYESSGQSESPRSAGATLSGVRTTLGKIALARSGDKGDSSNVAVIARSPQIYEWLVEHLDVELVREHFADIVKGDVDRYEAPNLMALNFILHDSLGGCGSGSLKTDAQGKTHGLGILYLELDVPDELLASLPK